jgi:O-antigen ligase
MIDYAKDALIAIVIVMMLQKKEMIRNSIWVLIVCGIFMGSIAIFQFLTGNFQNNFAGFGQASIQNITYQVNDYRIGGPIGDANFFALIMLVIVPLSTERFWHEKNTLFRMIAAIAFLICTITVLMTYSRGGLIGMIMALGVAIILLHPPKPVLVLLTLSIIVFFIQYIPQVYFERIAAIPEAALGLMTGDPTFEESYNVRASVTTSAYMMFLDHPILGVGLGNFESLYKQYSRQIGLDQTLLDYSPHSHYLQVLSELGLVGFVVFIAMIWIMMSGLIKARAIFKNLKMDEYANLVVSFGVGMIGYLIAAAFLPMSFPRYFWVLWGIGMAIAQIARREWNTIPIEKKIPS